LAVYTKKWSGSAWVTAPVKRYNGSSWVDAYTYRWNGSKWIQIYPETGVTQNFGWATGGKFRSWRSNGYETTTSTTTFKQGPYNSYSAAYGYSDLTSASIPGTKNVTDIDGIEIYATRGGAGSYNEDRTIRFWRSANKPDAVPTLLGSAWTATAYGVGSGETFYSDMSITTHTLNWVNQANSGKYLWIYTSSASEYLSLGPVFKLEIDYTYVATTAAFVDDTTPATVVTAADDYNSIKNTSYHTMTIYDDEIDMTLQEIMKRREDGIVEDIKPSCVDRLYTPKPWSRDYYVTEDRDGNKLVIVEVFSLQMDDEVQFSVDGINWTTMTQFETKFCFMEGILPPDFNKMYDWVYIRCVNLKTDELHFVLDIEPTIIIA
jgi:hypothetical protein